jgi:hypothetical protein
MAKQQFVSQEEKLAEIAKTDTSGNETMISYMKALPFDHIIGAPLMACIKAQQTSAQATWDAIREMGFAKSETAHSGSRKEEEVAMVSFLFQQGGLTRKITVPLLTLIPIPYMQIDSVDLKFRADMSTSSDGSITAKYSNTMDSQAARTSKYNVTNEIDINIHATTSGMPAGIAKMLEIFTNHCIDVMDYTPDDYSAEIIQAAKEEAERIKAEARAEVDGIVKKYIDGSGNPTERKYNLSLASKPSKSAITAIVSAVTNNSRQPVDQKTLMNSLQNSTNLTIARNVPESEVDAIKTAVEKAGGKVIVQPLT